MLFVVYICTISYLIYFLYICTGCAQHGVPLEWSSLPVATKIEDT